MSGQAYDDMADLAELADQLVEQAAEIRRQWGELAGALGVERPPEATAGEETTAAGADPARLVALDMLLAGHPPEQVEEHLARTFGADHAAQVVRAVFAEYETD